MRQRTSELRDFHTRRLRQAANRAGDGGDALDHGRTRPGDFALLERNDREGGKSIEEFARPQQEIRVARPPEPLVADHERLVDQHAAGRQHRRERAQQRPVQVIRDDDSVIAAAEPRDDAVRVAGFEVDFGAIRTGAPARCCSMNSTSRSTAVTFSPISSSSRVWRPAPAARSRTRPPARISGAKRRTQEEGVSAGIVGARSVGTLDG